MEWDSSWECLNFPPRVESPESSRAVTPIPCCRPAATVACWKGRLLGRIVDGDCGAAAGAGRGSRASAMPTSPSRPDPTSAHAHPLSLPPRANHFRGTNTPIPSRRWHLQHLDRVVPLPFTRAIYTSKAQGEKSNNLRTVSESNKHRHRPGRLPEPFCQAGSWASSQSPLPHGVPLTLTTSFFCQTQTEGRARAGSLTLPSISSSLGWLLAPGCGAEPRQGDPSVPPEPSRSLRNHPTRH